MKFMYYVFFMGIKSCHYVHILKVVKVVMYSNGSCSYKVKKICIKTCDDTLALFAVCRLFS